ncbi:MAG: type I pullulanase [Fusobacteriia bacterium 4572_132]|nr:MAG: type I pullulanase [Fusobacteriia bacterium 4572_132]
MKKLLILLIGIILLGGCTFNPSEVKKARKIANSDSTTVILHYSRFEKDYDNLKVVAWANGAGLQKIDFIEEDAFGKIAVIKLPVTKKKVGITILKDSKKTMKTNRYVSNIKKGLIEAWIIQRDEKVYYNIEKADNGPRIYIAKIEGSKEIDVELSNSIKKDDIFKVLDEEGKAYKIKGITKLENKKYKILMENILDVSKEYEVSSNRFKKATTEMGNALIEDIFTYNGDDLGNSYSKESTIFKVWTPVSKKVDVLIYDNSKDETPEVYPMSRSKKGVWEKKIKGNLEGKQYKYRVNIYGKINETVDPYARGLNTNSKRAIIFDLNKTDPKNWDKDIRPVINKISNTSNYEDHIIWEVHVRDFSIAENSGMKYKGKYMAFTEEGTHLTTNEKIKTGIAHLKELGVTTIHLNPVYDFGSVDETGKGRNYYNWGYDPYQYNVPEGSYATNPDDLSRVIEFKKMVQSLHKNGFRVVMDVVYNHTYTIGNSIYDELVPKYYYRMNEEGRYANGSGCGSEVATEKPMVRKFILDSVKYWVNEYHIDGFRFDLMGIMDVDTMKKVEESLHKIDESIIIYGEPWSAGNAELAEDKQFVKGTQKNFKIAVFNDNIREAIKGGNDGGYPGFALGKKNKELLIKKGVVGTINYSDEISDFTVDPGESINYASAHDNLTLWDKIGVAFRKTSEEEKIKMDRLSQAIVLTSQGIPFILAGEEMLRSKNENSNSYDAGDKDNMLRWERKEKYNETFEYYRGLIELRKKHPAFRMTNAEDIKNNLKFYDLTDMDSKKVALVVAYTLNGKNIGDNWEKIMVIYNGNRKDMIVKMPEELYGSWDVVVNAKKAGVDEMREEIFEGEKFILPATSAMVLKSND